MKKVMILTASTGEGHNAAAKSLQDKYEEKGYITYKVDFLKESSSVMNTLVADGYRVIAQNFPNVYGIMYETADRKNFNKLTRGGYYTIERRIINRLEEVKPDIVIATHPFAVGLIDHLKRKNKADFRFMQVVTDFKAHYSYISSNVDAYITGSEYTKKTLIERNVPEDRIYPYGIPVNKEFQEHSDPRYIRPGLNKRFHVLVMGGSMGSKDIYKVVERLVVDSENYYLDVVCGRNKILFDTLTKKYNHAICAGKITIHGFTRKIPEMMDEADVIVTKPGGLTTTEALSKKLPMIIPFAIPGQEQENTDFLVKEGVAIRVDEIESLPDRLEYLRKNPRLYNRMVSNMKRISDKYSIDKIVDLSETLISERGQPYKRLALR
ncbi:MGDG synthase family glycosyltransferase [Fusibacter sp. JL216-2]|uniref:MGDG synthase family glycosyltransferase n=1 Tax=Fusibacter sp. JL216-2 TaxID=3071453 RepID=UPI003D32ED82